MSVPAELLQQIHRIHRQLADLRDRQSRGPRQLKAREANVDKLKADVAAAQDAARQSRKLADAKQLDLKSSEARIGDWKVRLNTCNSNKEFQTMKEQIAAAEMACSVLADEILEAFERADKLALAITEANERLQAGQTELAKFRDGVAEELAIVAGDVARLENELLETEKRIPADFRDSYTRVIRGKGADGLAPMEDGVCGGCGQQITLNMQNELLLERPIFCKACGRLLYRPE